MNEVKRNIIAKHQSWDFYAKQQFLVILCASHVVTYNRPLGALEMKLNRVLKGNLFLKYNMTFRNRV